MYDSFSVEKAITVDSLVKKYRNFTAVNGISFKVEKSDIFAFLGPNGAGKTTTIKILTTLIRPTSGSITVNGFDPVDKPFQTRKSFGIVFQDPSLDDELTAYENMDFHAVLYKIVMPERKERIRQLLEIVNLWDKKDCLVKTFSGGMKRRLEIARGLLHRPEILFLDEPTLGLDPQTRNQIWKYIKNLNNREKTTIFFTTHYMEEAEKIAKNIAIIDQGKIIIKNTPNNIKKITKTNTLEEAFLSLTGKNIRDDKVDGIDRMRLRKKMMEGKRI